MFRQLISEDQMSTPEKPVYVLRGLEEGLEQQEYKQNQY